MKRYYSKLNDQTVFVETLNTARAASCDQSQTSLEENGDMCAELLANLPDIHSTFVGTGTFVKHSGKIRVLTAEHVCHADEIPDTMEQEGVVIKIDKTSSITIKSQLFSSSAKIIKMSKELDLCLLEIENVAEVKPAKISKKTPKRGDHVHYAGAPYGMISDTFLLTFEGTYAGDYTSAMVFSLPCAQGASGSSIRNRKNEIVSMVQRVHPRFNHICLGVKTEKLKDFLSSERL